jgi:hypothetical protein
MIIIIFHRVMNALYNTRNDEEETGCHKVTEPDRKVATEKAKGVSGVKDEKTRLVAVGAVETKAKAPAWDDPVQREKAAAKPAIDSRRWRDGLTSHSNEKEDKTMPGLDRSGPMGAGPMTGGRRGLCAPATDTNGRAQFAGRGFGRGMGRRRGAGFGVGGGRRAGRGFGGEFPRYAGGSPASKADEMAMLKAEADAMRASLETIHRRIAALEGEETA